MTKKKNINLVIYLIVNLKMLQKISIWKWRRVIKIEFFFIKSQKWIRKKFSNFPIRIICDEERNKIDFTQEGISIPNINNITSLDYDNDKNYLFVMIIIIIEDKKKFYFDLFN